MKNTMNKASRRRIDYPTGVYHNHAISEDAYRKFKSCILYAMANDAQEYRDNRIAVWCIGERNNAMFSIYPRPQARALVPNDKFSKMKPTTIAYWGHVYEGNLIALKGASK